MGELYYYIVNIIIKRFGPVLWADMKHIHNGLSECRRLTSHSLLTVRRLTVCQTRSNLVTEHIKCFVSIINFVCQLVDKTSEVYIE
jgi:hypothetical protein